MVLKLKRWREKRGLSLRTLAEISGVHYVSLVRIEGGELDPRLSTLLKLAKALEVQLAELVGEGGATHTPRRRLSVVRRGDRCPQKGCPGLLLNKTNTVPFHSLGFEIRDGVQRRKLACSICGYQTPES